MSDTPRTDAEEFDTEDICNGGPMAVESSFARQLERELKRVEKIPLLLENNAKLRRERDELRKDKARLDWLADRNQHIGNVQLPSEYVLQNLDSLRNAIDATMEANK